MSIVIGLTGMSGSGKTTACAVFLESGFGVINCDELAHEVLEEDYCKALLVAEFGDEILNPDESLNRRCLGNLVFSDKQKLDRLNEITHPLIIKKVEHTIESMSINYDVIILDAPTLFESGADKICDKVIAIIASDDVLISRIMERDNLSESQAQSRLKSQQTVVFFNERADVVLENSGIRNEFLLSLYAVSKKIREGDYGW